MTPEKPPCMYGLHFFLIHPSVGHSSRDFPSDSDGKESVCNVGDLGSIPGLGRCPGEGNGNPLQYSCPENPMDGESLGSQRVRRD